MTGLEISPLGLIIGLSLGAVGGGGSVLIVPILVYAVGEGASAATTTSLLVVGAASGVGAISHWRSGRVDVRAGALVGICGIGGALGGSWLGAHVPSRLLLISFAILTLVVAATLIRRREPSAADDPVGTPVGGRRTLRYLVAGTAIGLLTGFFGVGGGFIVVPALVFALGFPLPIAIGTSLLVIAMNSAVALAARVATTGVDWRVAIPFAVAGLIGVLAGTAVADRVNARVLGRGLAVLLVGVGLYVGARALAS